MTTWTPEFNSRTGALLNPLPREKWLISGASTLDRDRKASEEYRHMRWFLDSGECAKAIDRIKRERQVQP